MGKHLNGGFPGREIAQVVKRAAGGVRPGQARIGGGPQASLAVQPHIVGRYARPVSHPTGCAGIPAVQTSAQATGRPRCLSNKEQKWVKILRFGPSMARRLFNGWA